MKKILAPLKYMGLFLLTLALLFGILYISALIPNDSIRENMTATAEYYMEVRPYEFYDGEKLNALADNYADVILLDLSWQMGRGDTLRNILDTDYNGGGEKGENYGLYSSVTEDAPPDTDYARYVHGSAAFIRILHLFTDVEGVKLISFIYICLMLAISTALLIKDKHYAIAAALLISLFCVQFYNIRYCLEYMPAFAICFTLFPFYLILERKGDGYLPAISLAGGVAVAFFDFLTTETLPVLLPLCAVIAVRAAEKRLGELKYNILLAIKCGTAFLGAYLGTFLVKWTAASIVTGESIFASALGSAGVRFGGGVSDSAFRGNIRPHLLSGLSSNLSMPMGSVTRENFTLMLIAMAVFFFILGSLWFVLRKKEGEKTASILLFAASALVLLRLSLLYNHSYVHCFFTYRALATVIFAFICACLVNLDISVFEGKKK